MVFNTMQLSNVTVTGSGDRKELALSSGHSNTDIRETKMHRERSLRRTVPEVVSKSSLAKTVSQGEDVISGVMSTARSEIRTETWI